MKIPCRCGAVLPDSADDLAHKAHVIPDQEWLDLMEALDAAIEQSGPSAREKDAACCEIRRRVSAVTRTAYQCPRCGRLYLHGLGTRLHGFEPGSDCVPKEIFRSRPSPRC